MIYLETHPTDAATSANRNTLMTVKRFSTWLLVAVAAGVVAAVLSRADKPDPPESWSPVEPS